MLNLLPPEIKSRHKVRSRLYSITVIYIVLTAVFILGPIAGATFKYIGESQAAGLESEITQIKNQIGQSKDVSDRLAFIESRLSGAAQFQEKTLWTSYITTIANATPSAVTLSSLRLEPKTADQPQSFIISGETSDRRMAILFHDKLASDSTVTKVEFETLSESGTNTGKIFTFTMRLTFKTQ